MESEDDSMFSLRERTEFEYIRVLSTTSSPGQLNSIANSSERAQQSSWPYEVQRSPSEPDQNQNAVHDLTKQAVFPSFARALPSSDRFRCLHSSEGPTPLSSLRFETHYTDGGLQSLFEGLHSHQNVPPGLVESLTSKMNAAHNRMIHSVSLKRLLTPNFVVHFENLLLAFDSEQYCREFQHEICTFISQAKLIVEPGTSLFLAIYQFWLKQLKNFTSLIWKHTHQFTVERMKMLRRNTAQPQQRKPWQSYQIKHLQSLVSQNAIFTQDLVQKLSVSLGRSPNSILSKVQKLTKNNKPDQDSLFTKITQVLRLYSDGLSKDSIIENMNESYEMGYNGQWQKSVGQLLSSRKQFLKLKGSYTFTEFIPPTSLKTFKDKVAHCFITLNTPTADFKSLVDTYIDLFVEPCEEPQSIEDRRKGVQANLSKTLSRYECFDCSKSKTIYRLRLTEEECDSIEVES